MEDLDAQRFGVKYSQKGKNLLDSIFGEFTPERDRVSLVRPRHEHQLVFRVEYQEREQFNKTVKNLCKWLKTEGDFDQFKSLMLY